MANQIICGGIGKGDESYEPTARSEGWTERRRKGVLDFVNSSKVGDETLFAIGQFDTLFTKDKSIIYQQYITAHGEDLPEIRNWKWGGTK